MLSTAHMRDVQIRGTRIGSPGHLAGVRFLPGIVTGGSASCCTAERKERQGANLCEACFIPVGGVDRAHESRGLLRANKLDKACRQEGGVVRKSLSRGSSSQIG
jgi:hypothetical protein